MNLLAIGISKGVSITIVTVRAISIRITGLGRSPAQMVDSMVSMESIRMGKSITNSIGAVIFRLSRGLSRSFAKMVRMAIS